MTGQVEHMKSTNRVLCVLYLALSCSCGIHWQFAYRVFVGLSWWKVVEKIVDHANPRLALHQYQSREGQRGLRASTHAEAVIGTD